MKDEKLKKWLTDRSWRYIKEIFDAYIEGKISRGNLTDIQQKSLKDFAIFFLIIFQNLLRQAFINRDIEAFEDFRTTTLRLFKHYTPSQSHNNVQHLEWVLNKAKITDKQRAEFLESLEKQKKKEDIEIDFKNKRNQMLFGLSSWVFDSFSKNKENEEIKRFYLSIESTLPDTLENFTEIFLQSHNFGTDDFWGWHWWDLKADGEVHTLHTLEKLEKFYCVRALSLLSKKSKEEIEKITLPKNRDLAYLAEGVRDLMKILKDIQTNPTNWQFILNPTEIEMVATLEKLLIEAKGRQEKDELEIKKKNPISTDKVEKFKNDVLEGFYEGAKLRKIFKYLNIYLDYSKEEKEEELNKELIKSIIEKVLKFLNYFGLYKNSKIEKQDKQLNKQENKDRFGINIVEDKGAFLEDWHISYGDWGKRYGEDLAIGENSYILEELMRGAKEVPESNLEKTLINIGSPENIILLATGSTLFKLEENQTFIPHWSASEIGILKKVDGAYGYLKIGEKFIPVFEIHHRKIRKQILIINKEKFGKFIQENPISGGEDDSLQKDIFYMYVKSFSEDDTMFTNFISKAPDWLKKIGTEEVQKEYLKERVIIKILEKFHFEKDKDFEAYKINISDAEI